MTGQQLRNSILQEAIHGRLVPNTLQPGEKTARELLTDILAERQKAENAAKGKKAKKLSLCEIEEEPWELPEGWCWCRLGDVCNVVSARRVMQSDWRTDGVPFYRAREIGKLCECGHVENELFIDEDLFERLSASGVPQENDLMVTAVGTLGKTYIVKKDDRFYYKDASVICFENRFGIDPSFLKHLVASPFFVSQIKQGSTGTTVGTITINVAATYLIPLPPLSIQHAIVEKIESLLPLVEEYDAAQGELKTLNEALPDKLRKSVLQEAIHGRLVPNTLQPGEKTAHELLTDILAERQKAENAAKGKKAKKLTLSEVEEEPWELPEGWCWCRLGDVFEIVRGGSPRPINEFLTSNSNGYNWIKIGDTEKNGKYINGAKEKIIKEGLKKTRLVHSGDLLLTNSMSFGRPYILNIDGCIHDGWLVLSPYLSEIDKEFFFYLLSSAYVYAIFAEKAAGGVVTNLKTEKVFDTIIPLPPLSIQHSIVEKIEEIFKLLEK